jgi:hypothetical protein
MKRADRILLIVALASGVAATLRALGTGGMGPVSTALLISSIFLALHPLLSLIKGFPDGRTGRGTILAVIFCAHLIATLFFFSPEDILNSRPVITLDHAVHYQQAVRAESVFPDAYRLHAYDPYFMAGYPAGTIFDLDSKGLELWCVALRFLGTARAFKLFILIGYLLLPLTMYIGGRRLGFGFRESVLSILIFLSAWHWGRPYFSEFRYSGMFSCLIASHLSILIIGLFRSVLRKERAALFWIAGPLVFLVHPTAAVLLPVPFLALFLVERRNVPPGGPHRKWELRILVRLLLWSLAVIAVNLVWLIPFFQYLDIKTASDSFFQTDGPGELIGIIFRPGNIPAIMLLVFSALGCISLVRNGRGGDAAAPLSGAAFLLVLAAYGTRIPVFDQMEPGRFLVPALIFMSPMAGTGIIALYRGACRILSSDAVLRRLAILSVVLLLASSPVFAILSSRAWYRHILSTAFTPEVRELVSVLKERINPPGRLMIEDGPAWNFGECFLPALFPMETGVEQVGGPYPWAFIRHNFTNFHMCRAMEKDLGSIDLKTFWDYMTLYDIKWILTTTAECRDAVGSIIARPPDWESRFFALWEINPRGGTAEDRGVHIKAEYDRIEVVLKRGEDGELPSSIILPYHWDSGLRVDPPAKISAIQMMDDLVPLILLDPADEERIVIEYLP